MSAPVVTVVGGGLAGCEAAWQLASRGVCVRLYEMKPLQRTPAQVSDRLAELVCSNSFRSDDPRQAIGLLHEELRRLGSLILGVADRVKVPAGAALAVDRHRFATEIEAAVRQHPNVEVVAEVVASLPPAPAIIATGPLTTTELAADLAAVVGAEHLAFHDAIAPIVAGESIDEGRVFRGSRYGKGGGDDYLNCPMTAPAYRTWLEALRSAERVPLRAFEKLRYFEGCLPIEVMADRGADTPRFGPMKPVGLVDSRTGEEPFAVVQLRAEDREGVAYNLVGFQTRLRHGEQRRVFRMIPGLERAVFLRMGSVHRNTFLDAPRVLTGDLSLTARAGVRIGGQLSGVEGYVESTAVGFMAALFTYGELVGRPCPPPPGDTALGALLGHLRRPGADFQPSNVHFGLFPALDARPRVPRKQRRRARGVAHAERARARFDRWLREVEPISTTLP